MVKTLSAVTHSASTTAAPGPPEADRTAAELGPLRNIKHLKNNDPPTAKPDLRTLNFNLSEEMPIDIIPYIMITWGSKSAPQEALVWQ